MITIIVSFFILSGAFFALIAAIGVVRMPDLFCRMHAATKAGAFGLGLMLIGLIVHAQDLRVVIQSAMIIAFFYLTAPIAAHLIGRVALFNHTPMWKPVKEVDSPTGRPDDSPTFKKHLKENLRELKTTP